MKVIRLTKGYESAWDEFVNSHPYKTLYHTIKWKTLIQEVYNFLPVYLLVLGKNGGIEGIMPSFFVKNLFVKKIVSVPFNYYGGPLVKNKAALKSLILYISKESQKRKTNFFEMKMPHPLSNDLCQKLNLIKTEPYFLSILDLTIPKEKLFKNFKRLVKRKIKQAESMLDFKITFADSLDDVAALYKIMVKLYVKKHLTIPQPYKLFKAFWYNLIQKGDGYLMIAKYKNKIVGGTILLTYNNTLFDAWSISEESLPFSPNYSLIWEAINLAYSKKYSLLDLGVTSPNHQSLLDFKSRWGAKDFKFYYYYYLIKGKIPHTDYFSSYKSIRHIIKYVPLPIIKIFSPVIVKQFC